MNILDLADAFKSAMQQEELETGFKLTQQRKDEYKALFATVYGEVRQLQNDRTSITPRVAGLTEGELREALHQPRMVLC